MLYFDFKTVNIDYHLLIGTNDTIYDLYTYILSWKMCVVGFVLIKLCLISVRARNAEWTMKKTNGYHIDGTPVFIESDIENTFNETIKLEKSTSVCLHTIAQHRVWVRFDCEHKWHKYIRTVSQFILLFFHTCFVSLLFRELNWLSVCHTVYWILSRFWCFCSLLIIFICICLFFLLRLLLLLVLLFLFLFLCRLWQIFFSSFIVSIIAVRACVCAVHSKLMRIASICFRFKRLSFLAILICCCCCWCC